uniref:Transcription initiation factor TFIID subunit 4-like n=1 Tax=Phallusia mammillata TaxID=59560 RepID=A0A6F9DUZ4_9ASCI|nr:transcription initiation factor TFIID subunit 4-like [Phallusia mammillata]
MPAAYNSTALASVKVTVMSNASEVGNSTSVTYATLSAPHMNNTTTNSTISKQGVMAGVATKYIQLQSVRPSIGHSPGANSNQINSSSTVSQGQRLQSPMAVQVRMQQQRQQTPTPATSGITVPPGMILQRTSSGELVLVNGNSTSTAQLQTNSTQGTVTPVTRIVTTVAVSTLASVTTVGKPVPVSSTVSTPAIKTEMKPATSSQVSLSQEDMVNVNKCRNFLTTLIKLASGGGQREETVRNVKALVQNLIDDKINPEDFTKRLQSELNSSPQPYLVPFLKKSLPLLRLTMMQQSPGSQVPNKVAVAAKKVSSLASDSMKSPASPKTKPMATKLQKPVSKMQNVPDIRLPRVTSSDPPLKHPLLQAPTSHGGIHQPPHPSSVSGAHSSSLTMRPPTMLHPSRNQKWQSQAGGGSSYKEDDDINDVASMAGVNLSEESARILATNSELVGAQSRSCQDEAVVNSSVLQRRMSEIASRTPNIQNIHTEAVKLLACAAETRLKDLVEKLSTVVCHRMVNYREEDHYKACSDVKMQLKFLQELDQIEKKKHDEAERDILMRAIKSRSKNDNPEQLRLKERAKEMQQQEMEKLQIRNADETARNAIGPRKKKPRIDSPMAATTQFESSSSSRSTVRSRTKRVNVRDLTFVLEHERTARKSTALYKSYLK